MNSYRLDVSKYELFSRNTYPRIIDSREFKIHPSTYMFVVIQNKCLDNNNETARFNDQTLIEIYGI